MGNAVAIEPDHADVIGKNLVPPVVEPCGERRFALARRTHERNCPAVDLDSIGVKRQQPALMEQGPERGTQQEETDVPFRNSPFSIDDYCVAAADSKPRN